MQTRDEARTILSHNNYKFSNEAVGAALKVRRSSASYGTNGRADG
jgi:hypothetical protein